MNVMIDRDGCISCGMCAATCPDVFRMADDGLAEVYKEPTSADEEMVKDAADGCPVEVIHVDD